MMKISDFCSSIAIPGLRHFYRLLQYRLLQPCYCQNGALTGSGAEISLVGLASDSIEFFLQMAISENVSIRNSLHLDYAVSNPNIEGTVLGGAIDMLCCQLATSPANQSMRQYAFNLARTFRLWDDGVLVHLETGELVVDTFISCLDAWRLHVATEIGVVHGNDYSLKLIDEKLTFGCSHPSLFRLRYMSIARSMACIDPIARERLPRLLRGVALCPSEHDSLRAAASRVLAAIEKMNDLSSDRQ